jgi:hypothetical protein
LQAPGYGFHTVSLLNPDKWYGVEMYSVVFVTPSDVSFSNIGIAELDVGAPHTTAVSNVLVPVGGTNAWLLSCDYDSNQSPLGLPPAQPVTWDYTYGTKVYATASKVPFSKSQTTLSHAPGQNYVYQKVQVQALSPGGIWTSTPGAPSALVQIPSGSPDGALKPFPLGPAPRKACIALVQAQFGEVL